MEFDQHKPIYLQIADAICERILTGLWPEGNRIPSVRECGISLEVNPNTVARSYDELSSDGIIHNKRGIGYFVSPGKMDILGISIDDISSLYHKYISKNSKE